MLRFVLCSILGLALGTVGGALLGCNPQPPAATPSPSPAPLPSSSAALPAPVSAASSTTSPAPSEAPPIKAISRGTGDRPAHYTVRGPTGKIVYDVRSITVVYDRATDGTAVATFTKPDVIFHSKSGRTIVANSPEAVAHDKDKSVEMTGGVHARTDDGKVLTCDTLTYDAKNERIRGSGNVVLTNTKTRESASGQTLVSDLDFEHLTLSGNQ